MQTSGTHNLSVSSPVQRERLAYIEHLLLFKGEMARLDLIDRFGIAAAQATKDLAHYHNLAPGNVDYDKSRRMHIRGENFIPLFDYDAPRVLATLYQGYGDGLTGKVRSPWPCEAPHHLNMPSLDVIATVCEAIYKRLPLNVSYVSLSSGEQGRVLVPHTLVDNGLRWHVRAFDRNHNQFRDFVLTRIKQAVLENSQVMPHEEVTQDKQWNRIVDLELRPHPHIQHKEAILLDYQMQNGVLHKECRAAVAGYLLRRWNIDCSPDHALVGAEYQLCLGNPMALYGVENLVIAPGYQLPANGMVTSQKGQ